MKHIPNLLTLFNLLCGCLGIIQVFEGNLTYASYLIWVAGIADFLDGFAARMLNVKSSVGKELDSLADMVSFGVLPSMILFKLISMADGGYLAFFSLSVALLSALRLARFNVDTRQEDNFIGLPTPACALFISSIPFVLESGGTFAQLAANPVNLAATAVILALLLVAPIPLFSLKFKDFGWENNAIRYIFAIASIALIIIWKIVAIPAIIGLYLVLSILTNLKITAPGKR